MRRVGNRGNDVANIVLANDLKTSGRGINFRARFEVPKLERI
jgi:hypothetical protein